VVAVVLIVFCNFRCSKEASMECQAKLYWVSCVVETNEEK